MSAKVNGDHKLILDAIKDVRADIRQINERLEHGALNFAPKSLLWKTFGVLFVLISALAGYVFRGGK